MAANQQPVFEGVPFTGGYTFLNADSGGSPPTTGDGAGKMTWTPPTGAKALKGVTGAAAGTRVDSITVISTDTVARAINFYLYSSANTMYTFIGQVQIPIGSGLLSTAPKVEALRTIGDYLIGAKLLASGDIIYAQMASAVTASLIVSVTVTGGHFTVP